MRHTYCRFTRDLLLLLLTSLPAFAIAQEQDEKQILARVGAHTITAQEYLERIDLVPWPGKDNPATRDSAKINALASLIAEKLLSLQAVERGIMTPQRTAEELQSLERLFSRDELFRTEVVERVTVNADEVAEGLKRFAFVLVLNSFIVKDEEAAQRLAEQLNQRHAKVQELDLRRIISHDTITIRFGQLKEFPERMAYAIDSIGNALFFSTPQDGWVVLQLLERQENEQYLKASGHERRATVKRIVQERKEHARAEEMLREVFTSSVKLEPATFQLLADRLRAVLVADSAGRRENGVFQVTARDADALKAALGPEMNQRVATMGDHRVTLGELVDELSYWAIEFPTLQRRQFMQTLNRSIQQLVEAAIISHEAIRRGMNQRQSVRRALQMWGDAVQADKLLRFLVDSLGTAVAANGGNERTLDPSSDPALKASGMMNSFLAALAEHYGVEIYFDNLRNVSINPHNMVTKRFIGFGGVTMGAPMILRLWDWLHVWQAAARSQP